MTEEELTHNRNELLRLTRCERVIDAQQLLELLGQSLFTIITEHGKIPYKTQAEGESKLIVQMIFSKILNLRDMLTGITFYSNDNRKLENIIDPIPLAVLIRNAYETLAMFNVVYVAPKSDDERLIAYNLWVIAGLKYRQRFIQAAKTPENIEKMDDEARKIILLTEEIYQTKYYNSLPEKYRNLIDRMIKDKDYKLKFEALSVKMLSWAEITNGMGLKENMMEHMYTYFSLYAHPSNVSVFQFRDFFKKGDSSNIFNALHNISTCSMMISTFIKDYIALYPEMRDVFDSLPKINQYVINFLSNLISEQDGHINNACEELG